MRAILNIDHGNVVEEGFSCRRGGDPAVNAVEQVAAEFSRIRGGDPRRVVDELKNELFFPHTRE